jgi:hypothetical protein
MKLIDSKLRGKNLSRVVWAKSFDECGPDKHMGLRSHPFVHRFGFDDFDGLICFNLVDVDRPGKPVGGSRFLVKDDISYCHRLFVDQHYFGMGLGRSMISCVHIDLGLSVVGFDEFQDSDEIFWGSWFGLSPNELLAPVGSKSFSVIQDVPSLRWV